MEIQKKKCMYKEHGKIDAIIYCRDCKVYMCNKCDQFHSNLLSNHKCFNIDKDNSNIFTGICFEDEHQMKLEFFCKTHNKLCCGACITKIKTNSLGKHKDCDVCLLQEIKNEKLEKLNENIKYLEDLSKTLEDSIKKIKEIFEKISLDKEELKKKITKIFTNIRNEVNNREDKLLLEIEEKYQDLYFKEDIIRDYEKLPTKVNLLLEKNKKKEINDNEQELNVLINNCLEIENNIKNINDINEKISTASDVKKATILFYPDDEEINKFLEMIKGFGKIDKENIFYLSSIINNSLDYQNCVLKWIKEKTNKNKFNIELIFQMSKNGSSSDDFHKICDNQGPTLILIKTSKNKIFGGFTPLNWLKTGKHPFDKDNQTFIFSLNIMKKFDMRNPNQYAIKYNSSYGPNFGDCDIKLNKNLKSGESYANSSCNYLSNNNLELTGGKGEHENFVTDEFEVYKIVFN